VKEEYDPLGLGISRPSAIGPEQSPSGDGPARTEWSLLRRLIVTKGLAVTCEARPREFDRDWLSQVRSNETKRLTAGFDRSIAC
jgi:hypothetical protein